MKTVLQIHCQLAVVKFSIFLCLSSTIKDYCLSIKFEINILFDNNIAEEFSASSEAHLESSRISAMELFCKNGYRLKAFV